MYLKCYYRLIFMQISERQFFLLVRKGITSTYIYIWLILLYIFGMVTISIKAANEV